MKLVKRRVNQLVSDNQFWTSLILKYVVITLLIQSVISGNNVKQSGICKQKWDSCMDTPIRGKYLSELECDDAMYEKFNCPRPTATVQGSGGVRDDGDQPQETPRKSSVNLGNDRERNVEGKPERVNSGRVDTRGYEDDLVRTKDKTTKKKEEIYVKEDLISIEETGSTPRSRDDSTGRSRNDDPPARTRNDDPPARVRNDDPPARTRNDDLPARVRNDDPPARARNDDPPARARNDDPPARVRNDDPPGRSRDDPPARTRNDDPSPSEPEYNNKRNPSQQQGRGIVPQQVRKPGDGEDRRRDKFENEESKLNGGGNSEKAKQSKKDEEAVKRLEAERERLRAMLDSSGTFRDNIRGGQGDSSRDDNVRPQDVQDRDTSDGRSNSRDVPDGQDSSGGQVDREDETDQKIFKTDAEYESKFGPKDKESLKKKKAIIRVPVIAKIF